MRTIVHIFYFIGIILLTTACARHAVPKPYGFFRIAIPDTSYTYYAPEQTPYRFMVSNNAYVALHPHSGERYWIDIQYPTLNATVHCSYKPIHNNLRELSKDAEEFIYSHTQMASAIPEQDFANFDASVWGVYCELKGNTATPIQFFLTDSMHHFFRAAVYCNTVPNQDSLAPIHEYLRTDMRRLIESFEWQ